MTISLEEQLSHKGIAVDEYQRQINLFKKGFTPTRLNRACAINDGIIKLTQDEEEQYILTFDQVKPTLDIVKFVPASGAASRMFKHLFQVHNDKPPELTVELINNIERLPFYHSLSKLYSMNSKSLGGLLSTKDFAEISTGIIEGLKYKNLPKGLIPFHSYHDKTRNAFEEHLIESKEIIGVGTNHIHFTVSQESLSMIQACLENFIEDHPTENLYNISYSFQEGITDTVAVNLDNTVYTQNDGSVLFRPGGHGSLIYNLNEIDADLVFIKNIDNVVPDKHRAPTIKFKKILAGFAINKRTEITDLCRKISSGPVDLSEKDKTILKNLNIDSNLPQDQVFGFLNRPLRVCGMVVNTGEPGGGPFWAINSNGHVSRQIVEKAQVNLDDQTQSKILNSSTHFNPVDMVCMTKDYNENPFDLLEFVDKEASFISEKSIDGVTVKALEHPGLWNGAMAEWNTYFVEVPLSTFNPVKTVNDLLRPMHQSS